MAGSYGMKTENYAMSRKMAELVLLPKIEAFEGNKINIEHLNSGLYIINFFIDNKTIIKKVIKQNP